MIQFDKTETQIRILGLSVSSIFFIYSIISLFYSDKSLGGSGFLDFFSNDLNFFKLPVNIPLVIIVTVIFLSFIYVFYLVTKEERLYSPDKKSVAMLVFLALSAFSTCAQIPYVIDVLAGFILPVRCAPLWILSVLMIELSLYTLTPHTLMNEFVTLTRDFGPPILQMLLLTLTFIGIHCLTYFLGVLLSKEVKQHQALDKVNAELKATQKLYETDVRLEERVYIARELHDTIGHSLTAISTNLQLAEKLCNNEAKEPIQDAYNVSKLLLSDVREIVTSLRTEEKIDLYDALVTLVSAIKYPKINIKLQENLVINDPSVSHAIFRSVQEIITNTIKHSKAKNLNINISKSSGKIMLFSKDDGIGTSKIVLANGLNGMKERVEEAGGYINILSEIHQGFAVDITIPIIEANYD